MISRRAEAGEPLFESFDEAFERLFRRAYRASYQILRNREDAEDVAMDTMARALRDWVKLESPADGWVARVATNRSIDLWRRTRRRRRDEAGRTGIPSGEVDELELRDALVSLSKRQREVLGLRYYLDLSEEQIAAALGCSTGSVKQHASRGLAALRRQLGDGLGDGLDDGGPGGSAPHGGGAGRAKSRSNGGPARRKLRSTREDDRLLEGGTCAR